MENSTKMLHVYESNTNHDNRSLDSSVFTDVLKKKWDDLHEEPGVFRYQITALNERIVDQYLLQLNTNRGTNRRMPENMTNIIQPFDNEKFNFTKVADKEVMFSLTKDNDESNKHAILVNVSPINRYHSLLCPSIHKRLPQVVTVQSLILALEMMQYIEDRSLKIGFNSLCALASVNHLHYHLFFEDRKLPVEVAKRKHLTDSLYILEHYVVPAFCFDIDQNIKKGAQDIFKLIQCLLQKSIAHNIFMAWSKGNESDEDKIKVFIWPRKSCAGVKNLAAFNVAVLELSGWFPVYDASEFENMRREGLEGELRKWKYEEFKELCDEVKSLF